MGHSCVHSLTMMPSVKHALSIFMLHVCPTEPSSAHEATPKASLLTPGPEASTLNPPPPWTSLSTFPAHFLQPGNPRGLVEADSKSWQISKQKKKKRREWQFDTALSQLKRARRVTRARTLVPRAQSQLRLHLPRFTAAAPCWGTRCLC